MDTLPDDNLHDTQPARHETVFVISWHWRETFAVLDVRRSFSPEKVSELARSHLPGTYGWELEFEPVPELSRDVDTGLRRWHYGIKGHPHFLGLFVDEMALT